MGTNKEWTIISKSLELVDIMDRAEKVGKLHLQGYDNTQIARDLDIPRREVNRSLEDFRGLLRRGAESPTDINERLMDIIFEADESFRMVIKRAWETVDQADSGGQLGQKNSALKIVQGATKDRADMLQKSGVSQDQEIIEQLNESERRQDVLIELLKEIRNTHPEVAELITRRLNKIQTEVESVEVLDGESD